MQSREGQRGFGEAKAPNGEAAGANFFLAMGTKSSNLPNLEILEIPGLGSGPGDNATTRAADHTRRFTPGILFFFFFFFCTYSVSSDGTMLKSQLIVKKPSGSSRIMDDAAEERECD